MSVWGNKVKGSLEVCVIAEDGEVILQIKGATVTMTVRSAEKEEKAAVRLTTSQAQMIGEVFEHIPEENDE